MEMHNVERMQRMWIFTVGGHLLKCPDTIVSLAGDHCCAPHQQTSTNRESYLRRSHQYSLLEVKC